MFGTAMPLLFPIALVSFSIVYVQDIILLIYFAQAPPTYDENLNISVIHLMEYAPIVLLSMGFW
jgi:hypothetical protein